jgi:hypothetical protein
VSVSVSVRMSKRNTINGHQLVYTRGADTIGVNTTSKDSSALTPTRVA